MIKKRKKVIDWVENAGYYWFTLDENTELTIHKHPAKKEYYTELEILKTVRKKTKRETIYIFKQTNDLDKLLTAIETLFDVKFI